MKPQPYAYWLSSHRKQFASLSEFRAWGRDRNSAWRSANTRKHSAQLRRQKIYQRKRMARLRGMVVGEIIRRIKARTPVKSLGQNRYLYHP
jgi:hypothetical protein